MKKWTLAIALVMTLAATRVVEATPLAPGSGSLTIDEIALGDLSWGAAEADTGVKTVTTPAFTAKMQTQVYRDTKTGYLDFLYTVENVLLESLTSTLKRLTMFQYPNASFTDVYFIQGSGVAPSWGADRGLDGTIGFTYHIPLGGDEINAGETSTVLIRTHDTEYQHGYFSAIDGSVATIDSFAPSLAPLPGSVVLFATGALSLGGGLFRRMRKGLTLSV